MALFHRVFLTFKKHIHKLKHSILHLNKEEFVEHKWALTARKLKGYAIMIDSISKFIPNDLTQV